ncbi:hypothetical protein BT93_L2971 [Corymbia citriodora subsp. variegata]|uniref:Uncharacterized protein n=1 Tax=Corymbia citriodora subsp. variegata TaxID=360336 RepID=A0A8T0CKW3_CORYI|nr:hypothetical protein BT93_L2971 [Corymbia citriodora subsp. variegata]
MTWLDLSGNEIVLLPRCIGQFTKLHLLNLRNCKQLREILALPPSLANLLAEGCESLESCPYLSHMSQYDGFNKREWLIFRFEDCHKLVQDQCSNNCNVLSIEGLLGQYEVKIIHPGSKMPKWFVHQCSNNCTMLSVEEFLEETQANIYCLERKAHPQIRRSVSFHLSSESYDNIAGFAFCAIVGPSNRKEGNTCYTVQLFVNDESTWHDSQWFTSPEGGYKGFTSLQCDYVCISYFPLHYVDFRSKSSCLQNHCVQITVSFKASDGILRTCGVHLVANEVRSQRQKD